jgi:osmotically-inducible protein OsmY
MVDPFPRAAASHRGDFFFWKGIAMLGRNQISDKDLLKAINQRLMRSGTGSQSRVIATVQKGMVTLTGSLQYAIQRAPIMKAVQSVPGISRIVDQMVLVPKKPQL